VSSERKLKFEAYEGAATTAFAKYLEVQNRIDKIEIRAIAKCSGNKGVAAYELKTSSEYWMYRDLCDDRDRYMKIASLNASMANMYK
jgi:hypothetical protein